MHLHANFQHGRLKVKTTEEQAEAKRLERLKKLKLYQGATAKIFAQVIHSASIIPITVNRNRLRYL